MRPDSATPLSVWLGVIAVATGTFSLVTAELLPVGLLTTIGATFGATDGEVGRMITVPGLVAALSAPLVAVAAGSVDRRVVLSLLMGLLAIANLATALAPSFPVLLAARVLAGISIGGFWTIAGGLGPRLVHESSAGRATSIIVGGVAVASVVGVPLGTLLGDTLSWRVAFIVLGVFNLLTLGALIVFLPRLPTGRPIAFRTLAAQRKRPAVRHAILFTLIAVTGHFSAYTFIRPFLEQSSVYPVGAIGPLLLLYGLGGIAGNFVAGASATQRTASTIVVVTLSMSAAMLTIPMFSQSQFGTAAGLAVWGLAYGGLGVSLQTWILRAAPTETEAATSLFVAVYHLSIALGSLIGGHVVDSFSPAVTVTSGGYSTLLAVVVLWHAHKRSLRQGSDPGWYVHRNDKGQS